MATHDMARALLARLNIEDEADTALVPDALAAIDDALAVAPPALLQDALDRALRRVADPRERARLRNREHQRRKARVKHAGAWRHVADDAHEARVAAGLEVGEGRVAPGRAT